MNLFNYWKCRKIEKLLLFYVDKSLSEDKIKYIEEHLSSCNGCVQKLAQFNKIDSTFKTLEQHPLPPGYMHELHFKLARANQEKNKSLTEKVKLYTLFPKLKYAAISLIFLFFAVSMFYLNNKKKNLSLDAIAFNVINLNQDGVIKFNINSDRDLENVTLKIELPGGIRTIRNGQVNMEQGEIIWQGDLDKGENVISIFVKGVRQGNWEAKAVFKEKSFIRKIKIPFTII